MTISFTLPRWYDLHVHLRQDALLPVCVQDHVKMACAGFLAMPNTKPPVTSVFEKDETEHSWSVERYRQELINAGGDTIQDAIVPLYLDKNTSPKMIEEGAKSGILKAAKYYPPHGTTGAEFGAPMETYIGNGVLQALQDNDIVLCMHGEDHGLQAERYFDSDENAEAIFYRETLPPIIDQFPELRMVGEHLTTKAGVDLIKSAPDHVMGSVTPQHLRFTIGHLINGLKYHLYCLPVVKFDADREAIRKAVTDPNNTKFFAGTDSAPHTVKCTPCGCAAGCYTGGIAPQIYAQAFEEAGVDLATEAGQVIFKKFLCDIGPEFYNLPKAQGTFTLTKTPQNVETVFVSDGHKIVPLPLGIEGGDGETSTTIPWSISQ